MIRRFLATFFEHPPQSTDIWPVTSPITFLNKTIPDSLSWISCCAPCFPVSGDKVTVLLAPSVFYETLVAQCLNAKVRIKLASLYLGTGALEQHLVTAIAESLKKNDQLRVDILLDFTRGTRGEQNSKSKLMPLLQQSSNFGLSLYHTPSLRGLTKRLAPPRWNELLGLQHMKIYLIDDTVILSGANLSNDYFTQRQDRYIMIEDKRLADFYSEFLKRVQEFSLKVDTKGTESLHEHWSLSPYEGSQQDFAKAAKASISQFFSETIEEQRRLSQLNKDADTWIFPTFEMGQIGIHHDSLVIDKLLKSTLPGSQLKLATGYFNLTNTYMNTLTKDSLANCSILMAHPNANGFQGAKGPAGGIPAAYTLLAKNFHKSIVAAHQAARITLHEYERPGWSYHAKGIWYYLPNQELPCLTVVGSSNYGERSLNRDLEAQICLITSNERLQTQLQQECDQLYSFAKTAERELAVRPIPGWVKAVVWLFKNFF